MDGDEIELTRDDLLLSRIGRRQNAGAFEIETRKTLAGEDLGRAATLTGARLLRIWAKAGTLTWKRLVEPVALPQTTSVMHKRAAAEAKNSEL